MTQIYEEALAVRTLAAELQGEDLELSIASETSFLEAVEAVLGAIRDAETMAEAASGRAKAIEARADAFRARAERLRDVLLGAMASAGQKTLRLPEATLTVSEAAPTAVVTDEAALPLCYWTEKTTRRADMRRITADLRAGQDVYGATLRNMPPKLIVRTK